MLPGPVRPGLEPRQALAGPQARIARVAPISAAPAMGRPATASPVRSQQQSRANVRSSCFGPVADKVVIDTGQFDRFRVISPQPLHQGLDSGIEIEDHAAGVSISYHALEPDKRRYPGAAHHRRHETVSGRNCMAIELRCNDLQRERIACFLLRLLHRSRRLPSPTHGRCGPDRAKCYCCHRLTPNSPCRIYFRH